MLTETDLNQFTGIQNYNPHLLGLKLTDGVKFLLGANPTQTDARVIRMTHYNELMHLLFGMVLCLIVLG